MVRVAAAFVTNKGKLLLFHRDNKPTIPEPDRWSLIGGHVEDGESYEQGLDRELCEEIGILPNQAKFLLDFIGYIGEHIKLYHVQLTDDQAEQIKLGDEGQEVKFFKFEEIDDLPKTTNLTRIFGENANMIRNLVENSA